jgi:hypothetical protein
MEPWRKRGLGGVVGECSGDESVQPDTILFRDDMNNQD